jgi:predicted CoA-binding protein
MQLKLALKFFGCNLELETKKAKELVEKNDIEYVDNKCTKMEYQKFFLKMRQAFPVLSD